ncbi:MAG: hypothetical protein ACR2K1_09775, partial [Saprospiraceae bacterium]
MKLVFHYLWAEIFSARTHLPIIMPPMTKFSILPLLLFVAIFAGRPAVAVAQDKEFTQFYATPLTLNPA